jgi:hypothetical protein
MTGLDVNMFKIFLLIYADDIVIFTNSLEKLQKVLIYFTSIVSCGK